jgi:hypothetical protein
MVEQTGQQRGRRRQGLGGRMRAQGREAEERWRGGSKEQARSKKDEQASKERGKRERLEGRVRT